MRRTQCNAASIPSREIADAAGTHGLTGYQDAIDQAEALTVSIKKFRDDFVVHRAIKNPGFCARWPTALNLNARLIVGSGTTLGVEHGDPFELRKALDDYLAAVLDLVEQRPHVEASPLSPKRE